MNVSLEPVPFERIAGGDRGIDVVQREAVELAGHDALVRETIATGETMLPEGTRAYEYLVDLDGETLAITTYEIGSYDFDSNRELLDEMGASLDIDG